jgi:hypothetical protein
MNQQASVASGTLSNYGPESDVRVVCGGASIKGRRPQQEDVIMLHANSFAGPVFSNGEAIAVQGPQSGVSLVGVYDGTFQLFPSFCGAGFRSFELKRPYMHSVDYRMGLSSLFDDLRQLPYSPILFSVARPT